MPDTIQQPDCVEFAIVYAERGLRVLPVGPKKIPLLKDWPENATTDLDRIRIWWTNSYRGAGIGIATGAASGIVVIDIDPRHGGEAGFAALQKRYGNLPATATCKTGGGGLHLYFKYPVGCAVGSTTNLDGESGVDLRGDGGQVVAPPTVHESGRAYEWAGEVETPVELPAAWIQLLAAKSSAAQAGGEHREWNPTEQDDYGARAARAITCLYQLAPWRAVDYDAWLQTGMALHFVSPSADMLAIWDSWSRQSANWRAGECAEKWASFKPDRRQDRDKHTVGLGKLIAWASEDARAKDSPELRNDAPPTDSIPRQAKQWYTIGELAKHRAYRTGLPPISTTYAQLDRVLMGGFRPQCVYVIAARTGSAKSTFGLNIARRAAIAGSPVLVCKLEEALMEAVWRIHAAASHVQFNVLLNGTDRAGEWDDARLADGMSLIESLALRFASSRDIDTIEATARAHASEGGKLMIVDQLSMVSAQQTQIGYERATEVSNRLRLLAKELNIAILLLVQVNRDGSRRTGDKDHLTVNDLRDSGCIENDAAGVLLIDKVVTPDGQAAVNSRYLEIIVGKNRYGPVTKPDKPVRLLWFPALCRIEDCADEVMP